jgi:hypothetical protein
LLFKSRLTSTRKYIKQKWVSEWLLLFCDFLFLYEKNKASKSIAEKELKKNLIADSANNETLKKLFGYFNLLKWLDEK